MPAPDSIIWEEGQESTVLVSTNRDDVDLKVDSVAMGFESVKGSVPHSGELMVLGASFGCQDWAVSRLTADALGQATYTLRGNIDRDNYTDTATVYYRTRVRGAEWPSGPPFAIDVAGPSGSAFSHLLSADTEVWEVEASSDDNFPVALTRHIVGDLTEETATTDEEVESIVLLKDTGVALKACSEHDDLVLTLHGALDEELNRYVVDIGGPPPTPVPGPVFDTAYATLRFCPDDTTPRDALLTGNEKVGDVIVTGTNLAYALTPDGDSRDYALPVDGLRRDLRLRRRRGRPHGHRRDPPIYLRREGHRRSREGRRGPGHRPTGPVHPQPRR